MTSAIAILTWNRASILQNLLDSIKNLNYPVAVFEDAGTLDNTYEYLTHNADFLGTDLEIESDVWKQGNIEIYIGKRNLGVAGNSNRALAWMWRNKFDHLCLCNDDMIAKGDFVSVYADAHEKCDIGLFCFNDFSGEDYKSVTVPYRGVNVKMSTRMTGIMMSITLPVVARIGFFDPSFGAFGQEHCSYTNRARIAGFMNIDNVPQHVLDVETDTLAHQECESSMPAQLKSRYDDLSAAALERDVESYRVRDVFRPFSTAYVPHAGGRDGLGIPTECLPGYTTVIGRD